jgi:hypothetical protein
MTIQTSVRVPPESQRIVYTDMFVLTAHTTKKHENRDTAFNRHHSLPIAIQ